MVAKFRNALKSSDGKYHSLTYGGGWTGIAYNKNMFDEEAQKHAFQMTYDAIMRVLTDDAKKYIESAVGDLETYITNKIESTVKLSK